MWRAGSTACGDVNWCSHHREYYGGSLKTKTAIRSCNSTTGYTQMEKRKTPTWKIHERQRAQHQNLRQPRPGGRPRARQQMTGYTQGNVTPPQREWSAAICSNMDGPGDSTPSEIHQTERQVLDDSTCTGNLKNNTNRHISRTGRDSQVQRTSSWLPKGRGKRGGTSQRHGINRSKPLCIQSTSMYCAA